MTSQDGLLDELAREVQMVVGDRESVGLKVRGEIVFRVATVACALRAKNSTARAHECVRQCRQDSILRGDGAVGFRVECSCAACALPQCLPCNDL